MSDHVSIPTPGFYVYRGLLERLPNGRWLRGPAKPVVIAKMVTPDPHYPDNPMDRSPVWYVYLSGSECELSLVWPFVAGEKITLMEYEELRNE